MSSCDWGLGSLEGLISTERIYYLCRGVVGTFVVKFYWKVASQVIYKSYCPGTSRFTTDPKHCRPVLFTWLSHYHCLGQKKRDFGSLTAFEAKSSIGHQHAPMSSYFVVFAYQGSDHPVREPESCQGLTTIDLTVESLYCYLHQTCFYHPSHVYCSQSRCIILHRVFLCKSQVIPCFLCYV